MADKGRYGYDYQRITDQRQRAQYDAATGRGRDTIFHISRNYCDFMFINEFVDQEFVDRHRLFVAGKRLNRNRMAWEYFVQSRDAGQYRRMLIDALYHPPHIDVDAGRTEKGPLVLVHRFEGKPLVTEYIANTMLGIEYLWGRPVILETTERAPATPTPEPRVLAGVYAATEEKEAPPAADWQRVRYTMEDRHLSREILSD